MKHIKKFRAWDAVNQKMSYWTMNDLCTWDEKEEKPSALDDWMQFSGLKDKNEVEIYEGDILFFGIKTKVGLVGMKGMIEFHEQYAQFGVSEEVNFESEKHVVNKESEVGRPEIIGNIYQNPELLHDQKSRE